MLHGIAKWKLRCRACPHQLFGQTEGPLLRVLELGTVGLSWNGLHATASENISTLPHVNKTMTGETFQQRGAEVCRTIFTSNSFPFVK